MADLVPSKLHFCGGCGTLQPLEEERPLSSAGSTPDNPVYKCYNCGNYSDQAPDIVGYFSPDAESLLRSVAG